MISLVNQITFLRVVLIGDYKHPLRNNLINWINRFCLLLIGTSEMCEEAFDEYVYWCHINIVNQQLTKSVDSSKQKSIGS